MIDDLAEIEFAILAVYIIILLHTICLVLQLFFAAAYQKDGHAFLRLDRTIVTVNDHVNHTTNKVD